MIWRNKDVNENAEGNDGQSDKNPQCFVKEDALQVFSEILNDREDWWQNPPL